MKVKIDEMTKLMKNVLAKNGLSKREAELLVEDYVLGVLCREDTQNQTWQNCH